VILLKERTQLLSSLLAITLVVTTLSVSISYILTKSSMSTLESEVSSLKTENNTLTANLNQLNTDYDSISRSYATLNQSNLQKEFEIQALKEKITTLNQTYFGLLLSHQLKRESYLAMETQNVTLNRVPAGTRRHYTLVNLPIPEDAGQDVALVHYDKNGSQLAVPFYYWMDLNATSKSVVSSGYFPFPCQILEFRSGTSKQGYLYIQSIHMPTESGYVCEDGDYLTVLFPTSPKGLADIAVFYWDENL
jgi:hypothetical protein